MVQANGTVTSATVDQLSQIVSDALPLPVTHSVSVAELVRLKCIYLRSPQMFSHKTRTAQSDADPPLGGNKQRSYGECATRWLVC